jgi:hypothetical protein
LKLFSSAMTPWISCALIIAVSTSRTSAAPCRGDGGARQPVGGREDAARLSDGWPHSAASHVSLKSSQRIIAPMLNAAWTGSSWYGRAGHLGAVRNDVPGTTGPSSLVQAG